MRFRAGGVDLGMTLLPQALKERGYSTHMLGKWHLWIGDLGHGPDEARLRHLAGVFAGAEDHWNHRRTELRRSLIDLWFDDGRAAGPYTPARKDQYGDELFTARFEKLIKEHPPEKPLFVYYAYQVLPLAAAVAAQVPAKYTEFRDIKGDNDWHYVERNGLGLSRQEAPKRRAQYHAMVSYLDHPSARRARPEK